MSSLGSATGFTSMLRPANRSAHHPMKQPDPLPHLSQLALAHRQRRPWDTSGRGRFRQRPQWGRHWRAHRARRGRHRPFPQSRRLRHDRVGATCWVQPLAEKAVFIGLREHNVMSVPLRSGRDKICTPEQFAGALKAAKDLALTGLVVIGGVSPTPRPRHLAAQVHCMFAVVRCVTHCAAPLDAFWSFLRTTRTRMPLFLRSISRRTVLSPVR